MNLLHGTREEKAEQIVRMTNADLFDSFEHVSIFSGGDDGAWEYAEMGLELQNRLQRIGFLPSTERLMEIRQDRLRK